MKWIRVLLPLLSLFLVNPSQAATLTVTSNSDSGPGTLRDAIAAASPGDTILFANNVTGTINLLSSLEPTVSLNIQGPGADVLTLSGNGSATHVFLVTGSGHDLNLSGLTITGATGNGIDTQSDIDISDCVITANGGRGISLETVTANISNTTISANQSGGIFAELGTTVNIENSTVSGNTADNLGGGAHIDGSSTLNGTNVTFSANTVEVQDGTSFRGGGAIFKRDGGVINLTNATLVLNEVKNIQNMTQGGGGILDDGGPVNLKNTILADNMIDGPGTGVDCFGTMDSQGNNLIGIGGAGTGCLNVTDGVNGDQVGSPGSPLDPGLGDLADNGGDVMTHVPLEGSPAVDKGTNNGCPAADARGTIRPLDGQGTGGSPLCDVGAAEAGRVDLVFQTNSVANLKFQSFDPTLPVNVTATLTNSGPDFAPGVSLSATLPLGISLLSASVGATNCLQSSSLLACDLGNLNPGDSLTLNFQFASTSADPVTVSLQVTADTTGQNIGNQNILTLLFSIGNPPVEEDGGCHLNPGHPSPIAYGLFSLLMVLLWGLVRAFNLRRLP